MLILTINAFPNVALQLAWAKECFRNACRATHEHFTTTDRIIKLASVIFFPSIIESSLPAPLDHEARVTGRVAGRNGLPKSFRSALQVQSTSTAAINANRDLSEKLMEGALYHYKVFETSVRMFRANDRL
jgi:hypothetical protein